MSKSFIKYEGVEWSLPLLFQYEAVYGAIFRSAQNYNENLPQVNLYGAPASAWTGGRPPSIFGILPKDALSRILKYVLSINAIPTFTFTYTGITKEDLRNKYANLIMETGFEFNARFIVTSDLLRDYIKEKNPNATVIASVIKPAFRFQGPDKTENPTIENETEYYNKLLKEYDIVVVRPEYSKEVLVKDPTLIDDLSRIEVLVNQTCVANCPRMPQHYKFFDKLRMQPENDATRKFECIRTNMPQESTINNHLLHDKEQINELLKAGVKHLKMQGRSDSYSLEAMMHFVYSMVFNQDGRYYAIVSNSYTGILKEECDLFNNIVTGNIEPVMIAN